VSANPARGVGLPLLAAAVLALGACTATDEPVPQTSSAFGVLGAAGCSPPSPVIGSETQATATAGVTAYGLLFADAPTALPADGTSIKMVVRMTGAGPISGHLTAPDGRRHPLDWGPELHGDSTYHRPGAEWGIGFSFDEPGCWQVNMQRGSDDRATFWFRAGAEE
jgi:hypothetical protein